MSCQALNTRFLSFLERGLSVTFPSISNSTAGARRDNESLTNSNRSDDVGKTDVWSASSVVTATLRAFQRFADEFELYADFIIAHDSLAPRLARLRCIPAFVEIEEAAMKQPGAREEMLVCLWCWLTSNSSVRRKTKKKKTNMVDELAISANVYFVAYCVHARRLS